MDKDSWVDILLAESKFCEDKELADEFRNIVKAELEKKIGKKLGKKIPNR